jgi:preprotein translocase subunit YajC
MIMFMIIAVLSAITFYLMRDRSEIRAKRAMKRIEKLRKGAEA